MNVFTKQVERKLNKLFPARKLKESFLCVTKGSPMVELMQQGTTVTSEVRFETVKTSLGH
jgi:hypothetical protein